MNPYVKSLATICLGIWILVVGIQMAGASVQASSTTSNVAANSGIGAIIGGGAGLGTWLIVGSIGVATGGTAFAVGGIAMTALGIGSGALAGAATGTSKTIVQSSALYSPWAYGAVIIVGLLVAQNGIKQLKQARNALNDSNRNA